MLRQISSGMVLRLSSFVLVGGLDKEITYPLTSLFFVWIISLTSSCKQWKKVNERVLRMENNGQQYHISCLLMI